MTVLIHKKEDPTDPGNWRPIALCSTITKLYASCLLAHISNWAMTGRAISQSQKGFMSMEGCYERNFTLQMALDSRQKSHDLDSTLTIHGQAMRHLHDSEAYCNLQMSTGHWISGEHCGLDAAAP
ncbi:hypothetical protein Y1Q_0002057 [Alligator mississippiensis]|uniref:Reverse transcriptase domain-containing protein n=1 Tax=Alligator mississippiensis TaxID=8496 RepID=A0A151MIR7_ALLMI|nr:hypothetical protein Y1Q_0002057 [Alligator mississippiensis]